MSLVSMTVQQIMDLELWDKVVEYKGWNPYILNEGGIDYDDMVEFDTEFKNEDDKIEVSAQLLDFIRVNQDVYDINVPDVAEFILRNREELLEILK